MQNSVSVCSTGAPFLFVFFRTMYFVRNRFLCVPENVKDFSAALPAIRKLVVLPRLGHLAGGNRVCMLAGNKLPVASYQLENHI